jgi:hypothetical protein
LLALVLLLALIGAGVYLVAMLRPDLMPPALRPAEPVETSGVTAPPPANATMNGEMLTYSVQVKAFTSLPPAREEAAAVQRRLESTVVFVSPEEIQGVLYYKVLAGLAPDTAAANRLRDRLVQVGAIDAEDAVGAWSLVQYAPMAFLVGEFTSREAAAVRADSLLTLQIPTYTSTIPYSDGSRRWQLLAGAYRDNTSSQRLADMLTTAGLAPSLTARVGVPVTFAE